MYVRRDDDASLDNSTHEVIMYSIYDTREPEGNGQPVTNDAGIELRFNTHDEAVTYALGVFGEHDVLRVVIAGSPE
jgi:hypothetical protein